MEADERPNFDELRASGDDTELLRDDWMIDIRIGGSGRLRDREIQPLLLLDERIEKPVRQHDVIVGHDDIVVCVEVDGFENAVHDRELRDPVPQSQGRHGSDTLTRGIGAERRPPL